MPRRASGVARASEALRHQRALWQRDGLCMCVIVESMGQIAFVTEVCVNCSKQQPAEAQRRDTLGRIRGKVQRAAAPRASSPSCKLMLFRTSPWSNLSHRPWLRGRTLLTHVQRTTTRNLEMLNWTRTKSRQRTCSTAVRFASRFTARVWGWRHSHESYMRTSARALARCRTVGRIASFVPPRGRRALAALGQISAQKGRFFDVRNAACPALPCSASNCCGRWSCET